MLYELSKNDKTWRQMALTICGNKTLADDITNDMYLKIYECGKKFNEINQWFIYTILKNLFLHHLRDTKKIKIFTDISNLQLMDSVCEKLEGRHLINEALKELEWSEREYLLHTHERSIRKNEIFLGITRNVLYNEKHKALKKLQQTQAIKRYKSA